MLRHTNNQPSHPDAPEITDLIMICHLQAQWLTEFCVPAAATMVSRTKPCNRIFTDLTV